jgi:SnoaL-like domain
MNSNEKLITTFYQSFQNKDFTTMQNCYSDEAVFNDEVFKNLSSIQVKSMWEMLIKKGKDLKIEFHNVKADEAKGSAEWIAYYTFSATKRKVVNRIKSKFIFENGIIVSQEDTFDFYHWAKQALGATGILLGWTSLLKKKVQQNAMDNLKSYMNNK